MFGRKKPIVKMRAQLPANPLKSPKKKECKSAKSAKPLQCLMREILSTAKNRRQIPGHARIKTRLVKSKTSAIPGNSEEDYSQKPKSLQATPKTNCTHAPTTKAEPASFEYPDTRQQESLTTTNPPGQKATEKATGKPETRHPHKSPRPP